MHTILFGDFKPKRTIDNPSEDRLREWSLEQEGIITEFGNYRGAEPDCQVIAI